MAYDQRMECLPLFISYPRTGAHWINCVMELYFDRPRLREGRPTFLDPTQQDWMWFHDHDTDLQIVHNNVLYLYRDPVETVYSNLVHNFFANRKMRFSWLVAQQKKKIFSKEKVERLSKDYYEHLEKWTQSSRRARTLVCHGNFRKEPMAEFAKICTHFSVAFDQERASWAFGVVTKEALVKKSNNSYSMGMHMLKKSYKNNFDDFSQEWGDTIKAHTITDKLVHLFS